MPTGPAAASRIGRWLAAVLAAGLLAGCGLHVHERVVCGGEEEFLVVTVYRSGSVGIGAHEYHPGNLPSWARNVYVTDEVAHVEIMQQWAGLDEQGGPTSGRELIVYEYDRIASVAHIGRSEMTAPDFNPEPPWEETHACEPFSEFQVMMVWFSYITGGYFDS